MSRPKRASASSASAAMGFIGFSSFNQSNSTSNVSSFYEGTDPAFKTCFKNLSKKDASTRLKALVEMAHLVETSNRDIVRDSLTHYYYQYERLSQKESDGRVRASMNEVLKMFFLKVPKVAVRTVDLIIAELVCSNMADVTTSEVRENALAALNALGGNSVLMDNFSKIETMIDKRLDSCTEPRLVASALFSLELLFPVLAPDYSKKLLHTVSSKGWKNVLGNREDLIRWYGLQCIKVAIEQNIFMEDDLTTQLASIVCKLLENESHSGTMKELFEVILSLVKNFPSFFIKTGDYRKTFFPSLWKLLSSGARSCGHSVYSAMLPLMSLIPDDVWMNYGADILADKWVGEMWKGSNCPEELGPHGFPLLTQSTAECIAFVIKTKNHVPLETFLACIRYFTTQVQRFKVGSELIGTLHMALTQLSNLRGSDSSWSSIQDCFTQLYGDSSSTALHVAELLVIDTKLKPCLEIAEGLFEMSLNDVSLCKSMSAFEMISLLVPEDKWKNWSFKIVDLAVSRKSTESLVCTCLVLRLLHYDYQEQYWTLFNPVPLNTISDAVDRVNLPRIECVMRYMMQVDMDARTLRTLQSVNWITQDEQNTILSLASDALHQFIARVFNQQQQALIDEIPRCTAVVQAIDFRIADDLWIDLQVAMSLVNETLDTTSDQTRLGLLYIRLVALFDTTRSDWSDNEDFLARRFAHLVFKFGLCEKVILNTKSNHHRLVLVCNHICEEVSDSTLLGFEEPADFLWHLIEFTVDYQCDWRDAQLVPYILADELRLCQVIRFGLSKTCFEKVSPPLISHLGSPFNTEYDEVVEIVLWPYLCDSNSSFKSMRAIVTNTAESLERLELLPELITRTCDAVIATADAGTRDLVETIVLAESANEEEEQEEIEIVPVVEKVFAAHFAQGDQVYYIKDGKQELGVVRKVHSEENPTEVYYTVGIVQSTREVQTIPMYLTPKYTNPSSLEQLNKLLAAARKIGDHKESIRLMKLQPSLLPRPVDSDAAKRDKLDRARKRHEAALEYISEAKALHVEVESTEANVKAWSTEHAFHSRLISQLNRIAAVTCDARHLSHVEQTCLLKVCVSLPSFASPSQISACLGKQADAHVFELLMAVLRVMESLVVHIPFMPDPIEMYLQRCVMSSLLLGGKIEELFHQVGAILVHLSRDHRIVERAYEPILSEILSGKLVITDAIASLVTHTPSEIVLRAEVAGGNLLHLLEDPEYSKDYLSMLTNSLSNVAVFHEFWGKRNALLQTLQTDFHPESWSMYLALVHKSRGIVVNDDEVFPFVCTALQWSLLGDHDEERDQIAVETLRSVPASSRLWYTDSTLVNRKAYITAQNRMRNYITPRIMALEFDEISRTSCFDPVRIDNHDIGTMSASCSRVARSVTALYEKEDCSVEIQIILPTTFPLDNVEIVCTKQLGIKQERWKRWVLQITTLLSSKDGTLLDALRTFKSNLDQEFLGVEACPICYTVLHVADNSLPKLKCSTCKNGFHTKCISKWFESSHKNECPMCKQPF